MSDDNILANEERSIASHAAAASKAIQALLVVRDRKLYEPDYATFEDYCRGRFGLDPKQVEDVANILKSMDPFASN